MNKSKLEFKKTSTIFLIGFVLYIFIEVLFTALFGEMNKYAHNGYLSLQGFSSLWMGLVGGFLLILLGKLNEIDGFHFNIPMIYQSLIGCGLVTLIELFSGYILNIVCGFHLWNYLNLPLNLFGQIDIFHSIAWFIISPFAFWLDDLCRWIFYRTGNFKSEIGVHIVKVKNLLDYYKKLFSLKKPYEYIDY